MQGVMGEILLEEHLAATDAFHHPLMVQRADTRDAGQHATVQVEDHAGCHMPHIGFKLQWNFGDEKASLLLVHLLVERRMEIKEEQRADKPLSLEMEPVTHDLSQSLGILAFQTQQKQMQRMARIGLLHGLLVVDQPSDSLLDPDDLVIRIPRLLGNHPVDLPDGTVEPGGKQKRDADGEEGKQQDDNPDEDAGVHGAGYLALRDQGKILPLQFASGKGKLVPGACLRPGWAAEPSLDIVRIDHRRIGTVEQLPILPDQGEDGRSSKGGVDKEILKRRHAHVADMDHRMVGDAGGRDDREDRKLGASQKQHRRGKHRLLPSTGKTGLPEPLIIVLIGVDLGKEERRVIVAGGGHHHRVTGDIGEEVLHHARHDQLLLAEQAVQPPLLAFFLQRLLPVRTEIEHRVGLQEERDAQVLHGRNLGVDGDGDRLEGLVQTRNNLRPPVATLPELEPDQRQCEKEDQKQKRYKEADEEPADMQ